jgi:hypothetical protein
MHHPPFSTDVWITVPETCEAGVRAALLRVIDQLTEQHSITSRRHSIAALVRKELDAEMARVIDEFAGPWNRRWLRGFIPSRMWAPAAKKVPISEVDGSTAVRRTTIADEAEACAREWSRRLRQAKISACRRHHYRPFIRPSAETPNAHKALEAFCGALSAMAFLADESCTFFKPKRSDSPTSGSKTRLTPYWRSSEYCDFCWRKSERHEDSEDEIKWMREQFDRLSPSWVDNPSPRFEWPPSTYWSDRRESGVPPSNIYCREHNPRGPLNATFSREMGKRIYGAAHRTGLRHRKEFHEELEVLRTLRLPGSGRFERTMFGIRIDESTPTGLRLFVMPASGIEPDLRRAAYALVDSGLRGTTGAREGRGKQEAAWILRHQGFTHREIASRLQLSIPGVRSALSRLDSKLARIQAIRWGSADFPLWE